MATNGHTSGSENLQDRPRSAQEECERLQKENARLRTMLGIHELVRDSAMFPSSSTPEDTPEPASSLSTPEEKIALFRTLFRGREDVYAVRWEGKGGRTGYSPAGVMDWRAIHSASPGERKRIARKTRMLLPLTDDVIRRHLTGKQTIGIYPLLPDETCWFLAVDFDKNSWIADAAAFLNTCRRFQVTAAVERSRSGNGAHIWIFFDRPVSAGDARRLGCALLTRTMERRHEIGLDSYDRLFPSQDTMPKGGFGNLIALPLQKGPREKSNSVFLNELFEPYSDQWGFLKSVHRIKTDALASLIHEVAPEGNTLGVHLSLPEEDIGGAPWLQRPSRKSKEEIITDSLPTTVRLITSNLVYVEKKGLPSSMQDRLIRIAAFQNPEFYKAQAMRLSTYGKPRVISCSESFPEHIGLPRGCFEDIENLFKRHGIRTDVQDERTVGQRIDVSFRGELRAEQLDAARQVLAHDQGILSAPTAFGKTVIGAYLVAQRTVSALVLVHRRQLMDQWRERLAAFLELPISNIGQFGGGKNKRTGLVDVAVIQSLQHKGSVHDFVAEYGHVIVDECHHLSAFTFEQVMKQVKARYILGLTATPERKDGHHPIIYMQCGPIRHKLSARSMTAVTPFEHEVVPRLTEFCMPPERIDTTIQEVYAAVADDRARNELILADLLRAVGDRRSPLLLTARTSHLRYFETALSGKVSNVFVLKGGIGKKQRRTIAEAIAAVPEGESRVILATGSYIGEGFDDARLDTLFLAMPISWKGTLQQYVGRLHRLHDAKREVIVYDYVDGCIPVFSAM